ncbi:mechanosensitive ion channel family protein [Alteromonas sp. ASW11-19]|uniref:Small-conductance mechanosensitive channel n=1 Tax=Alteromonas salexigens TaxID=2982530 RepID=A0ABT2VLI6_9ALTE|nr:mechanosensitive ion channel family protein [Alteromonas salexigens]MCU7553682.1 mechanosensitive ion channel family protein [Alteromonas salexigens]
MGHWLNDVAVWVEGYQLNLIATGLFLLAYVAVIRLVIPRLERNLASSRLKSSSAVKGLFVARVLTGIATFAGILLAWGVDFSGLLVLSTSIITLTGVALFASWSLISNITAYFILLTNVAYRRGNAVRIIDGDNYVEGTIADIGPFSTRLVTAERETVLYPNNLVLTRPVLINPKTPWHSVGKVVAQPIGQSSEQKADKA